jgi:hypothetical protein
MRLELIDTLRGRHNDLKLQRGDRQIGTAISNPSWEVCLVKSLFVIHKINFFFDSHPTM